VSGGGAGSDFSQFGANVFENDVEMPSCLLALFDNSGLEQCEARIDLRKPVVYLRKPGVYLRKPGVYLRKPGVYLRKPVVYLRKPVVYLRKAAIHLREKRAHLALEVANPHDLRIVASSRRIPTVRLHKKVFRELSRDS
jgi:hypothetical protein